jgi:hypothetical protein
MANALYDKGRQAFLEGSVAWLTDTIAAVLVNIAGGHYTVNLASDQYLSSISAGDRVATFSGLASKTSSAGVAGCADITWPTVSGAACGAVVIYKDTGVAGTSPLIAYIDTATGLPVTPGGGDIIFKVDTGANKLFKL